MENIRDRLFEMQDIEYRDFQCRLMPTVDKDTVIGVRTPCLRRLANEMFKKCDYQAFLEDLPHKYYEENNLHAFIIEKLADYDDCIRELDKFLPYVNNWATCDCMSPKVFGVHRAELFDQIKIWIASEHIYTVRFAVKTMMNLYSKEYFRKEHLEMVSSVNAYDYYLKMVVAWYFATELSYNYDDAVRYLEDKRLDRWTHNKAIQKAIESYRVSDVNKDYLKKLKI